MSSYGPSFAESAALRPFNSQRTKSKHGALASSSNDLRHQQQQQNVQKEKLTSAHVAAFRDSMDVFFGKSSASNAGDEGQMTEVDTRQDRDRGYGKDFTATRRDGKLPNGAANIQWKQLLDAIEDDSSSATKPGQTLSDEHADVLMDSEMSAEERALRDEIMNREATARRLAETLSEEIRQLRDGPETIQWMHERIFSKANPEALASLISRDGETPPSPTLNKLYPYLLTELSDLLRDVAPHAALLPLKLASTYSPQSYLHGCTASLYASAMKTRWQLFGDIEGCLALLTDMEIGATSHNHQIVELVSSISDALTADALRASEAVDAESSQINADTDGPDASGYASEAVPSSPPSTKSRLDRERERKIEARMFFSPRQRKDLVKMEEIVIKHRSQLRETLEKQDMLEDIIRQRERQSRNQAGTVASSSSRPASSSVNDLINSYGQARRPKTVNPARQARPHPTLARLQSGRYSRSGDPQPSEPVPVPPMKSSFNVSEGLELAKSADQGQSTSGLEATAPEPAEIDILSEAIEEIAAQPVKPKRKGKARRARVRDSFLSTAGGPQSANQAESRTGVRVG